MTAAPLGYKNSFLLLFDLNNVAAEFWGFLGSLALVWVFLFTAENCGAEFSNTKYALVGITIVYVVLAIRSVLRTSIFDLYGGQYSWRGFQDDAAAVFVITFPLLAVGALVSGVAINLFYNMLYWLIA